MLNENINTFQQYNFAIGILAMLLLGFGFLMVFVKKNGFSALTGTYLITASAIPFYFLLRTNGIINPESLAPNGIEIILYAEFAAASALIAMGAVLGRLRIFQYALIALLLVPAYMLNEWLVVDGGLGITEGFKDTAGSVALHAFGCYFGIGMTVIITRKEHKELAIESDATSDRFSMIGSMVLWIFWPSFCSAIVSPEKVIPTAICTILALCGATIATYLMNIIVRKGKIAIADIANASLAGGVAIGSTCDVVTPLTAFIIGIVAGVICVLGYAKLMPFLEKKGIIDTCGVNNLHGMPGIFGGIFAIFVVPDIIGPQLLGILITLVLALGTGIITGAIIKWTMKKKQPYDDAESFLE